MCGFRNHKPLAAFLQFLANMSPLMIYDTPLFTSRSLGSLLLASSFKDVTVSSLFLHKDFGTDGYHGKGLVQIANGSVHIANETVQIAHGSDQIANVPPSSECIGADFEWIGPDCTWVGPDCACIAQIAPGSCGLRTDGSRLRMGQYCIQSFLHGLLAEAFQGKPTTMQPCI